MAKNIFFPRCMKCGLTNQVQIDYWGGRLESKGKKKPHFLVMVTGWVAQKE